MGEIINRLGRIEINGASFQVELNHPTVAGGEKAVHLQTSNGRLEMTEGDFHRLALCVMVAAEKLQQYKDL